MVSGFLGCLFSAGIAVLDLNARMREIVHAEPREPSENYHDVVVIDFIPLTGLALAFWSVLLCTDVSRCMSVRVVWWFLASQVPGTLVLLGIMGAFAYHLLLRIVLSPVCLACTAVVDNLSMLRQYQKLQKQGDIEVA